MCLSNVVEDGWEAQTFDRSINFSLTPGPRIYSVGERVERRSMQRNKTKFIFTKVGSPLYTSTKDILMLITSYHDQEVGTQKSPT